MLERALPLLVIGLASSARAQDAFEVQVYDSRTAPAGQLGFELHANAFALESRELHFTLEPHVGLASWCEAGMYFTAGVTPDGRFDFAGVKVRFKVRWPEKLGGVVGLALNQEVAFGGGTWDDSGVEWELRPVIDADFARFYLSLNPIIATVLTGPGAGTASFEPALKGAVKLREALSLGLEYYTNLGPLPGLAPLAQQTHRLFAALDAEVRVGGATLELNLGVGTSLVGPEPLIIKLIFAADFD